MRQLGVGWLWPTAEILPEFLSLLLLLLLHFKFIFPPTCILRFPPQLFSTSTQMARTGWSTAVGRGGVRFAVGSAGTEATMQKMYYLQRERGANKMTALLGKKNSADANCSLQHIAYSIRAVARTKTSGGGRAT
ncbi:hypothetical protein BDZ91DRAFT_836560 [Kalaharituber pfeilii]|nr:hypothetical protein BDZ91DRAFT_836560 [Kalaharituber pfeilii]